MIFLTLLLAGVVFTCVLHAGEIVQSQIVISDPKLLFVPTVEACEKAQTPIERAECGSDYKFPSQQSKLTPWKILLLGPHFQNNFTTSLSGCNQQICPFSPRCQFELSNDFSTLPRDANVILISHYDKEHFSQLFHLVQQLNMTQTTSVVRFGREAWPFIPKPVQAQFSFEMSFRPTAKLQNPFFVVPPHVLLSIPHVMKDFSSRAFAVTIASDCHSRSERSVYIDRLVNALGDDRVDRFGDCYPNRLPGKSFNPRVLSRWKFFFAFENTIMDGYNTEKLYHGLQSDALVVYYGDIHVFNITQAPSFIKASDFSTPESLATYLLHLDTHPAEYHAYFSWKAQPNPSDAFTPEFLSLLAKHHPGPREMNGQVNNRLALCCRLCNPDFVKRPETEKLNEDMLHHEEIRALYYNEKRLLL